MYNSSSTSVKPAEGFALLVVIGMVAVASVAIGGLMTAVSVPNETFSNNSARILLSHKARMSSELILRDISENENSIESFALVETSGGASALSEWQQRCKKLMPFELQILMEEEGLDDVRSVGPVNSEGAKVTGYVRRLFYSDQNADGKDDDGNVGYLIASCATLEEKASIDLVQVANTAGIWRLVRSDKN